MPSFISPIEPRVEGTRPTPPEGTAPSSSTPGERAFADALAHDLRAPLRSIENFAALLDRRSGESLDPTSQDYLARIRGAASRMGTLLAGLSELSAAQRAEPRPTEVDLSLLAEWVLAELADADPHRQVETMVQPGLRMHGDERLLRQVLQHLLRNAWTFTAPVAAARIEVGGSADAAMQRLVVRDNGVGFDPNYAHKLFQPFQRLHAPDRGAGHGLGLAIVRTLAERLGGQVHAEAGPGGGAVFTFEWPPVPPAEGP